MVLGHDELKYRGCELEMNLHIYETIPLWGVFLFTLIVTLISYEVGFAFGDVHKSAEGKREGFYWFLVGSVFALSLFILAFSFNTATTLFEEKKMLITDEANAIETTYFRSGFLQQPYQKNVRALLQEYVSVLLEGAKSGSPEQLTKKYENYQDKIWGYVEAIADKYPNPVMLGLFIDSLNDAINFHAKKAGKEGRTFLPEIIWLVIYFLTVLTTFAIGYQLGLLGYRSFVLYVILVLAYTSIIMLIADLDRPQEGLLRTSRQALVNVYDRMQSEFLYPQ